MRDQQQVPGAVATEKFCTEAKEEECEATRLSC